MPKIRFVKAIGELEVGPGEVLMTALLAAGRPVASSCGGDGVCAKCKIRVIEGHAHLSPPNSTEEILIERLRLPKDVRIACQTQVEGDVTVDASYW